MLNHGVDLTDIMQIGVLRVQNLDSNRHTNAEIDALEDAALQESMRPETWPEPPA